MPGLGSVQLYIGGTVDVESSPGSPWHPSASVSKELAGAGGSAGSS